MGFFFGGVGGGGGDFYKARAIAPLTPFDKHQTISFQISNSGDHN